MMMLSIVLLATADPAAAARQAPLAPPPVAVPADQAQRKAEALELVRLVRTRESILAEMANVYTDNGIKTLAASDSFAPLEAKHPGVTRYVMDAVRPLLEAQTVARLPQLHDALATIYASALTRDEIRAARSYYESPGGRHLIAGIRSNYDGQRELSAAASNPDAPVSGTVIKEGIAAAAQSTATQLSAADKAALLKFMQTSAFTAIQRANPRLLQASVDWGNAKNEADQRQVNAEMLAAFNRYVEKQEAAK